MGDGGLLMLRSDGRWEVRPTGTRARLRGVVEKISAPREFVANRFSLPLGEYFAVGDGGTILRSADGLEWMQDPAPLPGNLNAVATAGADLFIVGDRGTVLMLRRGAPPVIEEQPQIVEIDGELYLRARASGNGAIGCLWVRDSDEAPFPVFRAVSPTIKLPGDGLVYRAYFYNAHGLTISEGVTRHRFRNLSTLANVSRAEGGVFVGFVGRGSPRIPATRRVLIRAIGPGLAAFGVAQPLPAPRLSVYANGGRIASNAGWMTAPRPADLSAAAQAVGAFPLQPGSADSAVLFELGDSPYSVHMEADDDRAGSALLEIYDVTPPNLRRLVNLSARARIAAGGPALVAGLVIEGVVPKRVLLRGAGPGLSAFGVADPLPEPRLTLRRASQVIATASAWHAQPNAPEIRAAADTVKAFPFATDAADAAMLLELPAGAYTLELTGTGGGGTGLIEAYEL